MGRPRIAVGAVALLLLAPLLVAAQGLGEASKKEKDRRQQPKASKPKTYTQDDLATLPPVANEPATSTGESTPPPGARGEPAAPERTSDDGEIARRSDESLWRGRVNQATARVERARRVHQTLAGMNLVPGYEYQDDRGRTAIGSVEQLQQLTAAAKAELDAAEKALADLLEEARREGVPPGWLR